MLRVRLVEYRVEELVIVLKDRVPEWHLVSPGEVEQV